MTLPAMPELDDTALSGANADYLERMYLQYLNAPLATPAEWRTYFSSLPTTTPLSSLAAPSPTTAPKVALPPPLPSPLQQAPAGVAPSVGSSDETRVAALVAAYRRVGHQATTLDPLGLVQPPECPALSPFAYGFTAADMDRPLAVGPVLGLESPTLQALVSALKATYADTLGVEYPRHEEHRQWLETEIETPSRPLSPQNRTEALKHVTQAEVFEQFLHVKFTGAKRFGLDGGESLMAALFHMLTEGVTQGVKTATIGMAHRGRLNVLTHILNKPFRALFTEFQGKSPLPAGILASGDVKYHQGATTTQTIGGQQLHLSLLPNPSHLEFVNPVVLGKAFALQQEYDHPAAVLPILIHGDAAFAGQGIVAESLMLSNIDGYAVGGTVHVVINNQIGFTTEPRFSRSGPYCTDLAHMIDAPILHVNGDDVDAVIKAAQIAITYRQKFQQDVVIDLVCYRRYGHNESDEPAFTQPVMYKAIHDQPSTAHTYAARLVQEGVLSAEAAAALKSEHHALMEQEFQAAATYVPDRADWLEGRWKDVRSADTPDVETAVSLDLLHLVGKALTTLPANFDLNSKIARQIKAKEEMMETGTGLDWAMGEALAFGTLVAQGHHVRLSGQDSERGTFSHRHAVWHDQTTGATYTPLATLSITPSATFEVHNSPLSEAAVLGFEYGYAATTPHTLTLWEAQFGDFANGAQVLFDQFISAGEAKWLRLNGLVVMLPHGFEGQGPEHSSARLERFLQLCAQDNMRVANVTTPANLFHILRRQVCLNDRKPLILMTPKSLLRHKMAISPLSDFGSGTTFAPVIGDDRALTKPAAIKRVVLCSGKVYYDLLAESLTHEKVDTAIVRVEQLYPFPADALKAVVAAYPKAEVVWCQEEPENMGAWTFAERQIERTLGKRPRYAGRPEAASPAVGSLSRHNTEQQALIAEALGKEKK